MVSLQENTEYGEFRLVRPLGIGPQTERWLAADRSRVASHVVHLLGVGPDADSQRRFYSVVDRLAEVRHAHLLPLTAWGFSRAGRAYIVTPFTGNPTGLVTLATLLADKGGKMTTAEANRAITQMLEAVDGAHQQGITHGPLDAASVLIDVRGRIGIEFFGLWRGLFGSSTPDDRARHEDIASVARLGYQALTGAATPVPGVPANGSARRNLSKWDGWFSQAFSGGFARADEAIALLPRGSSVVEVKPPRSIWSRVLGSGAPVATAN